MIAIPKDEPMRKLIATIAAAVALAGVGVATDIATSDAPANAITLPSSRSTGPGPFTTID